MLYHRFTDRARKVMRLANEEAQRLNHEFIGTEHILLALIKEGCGVAANVLKNLEVAQHKIRGEIEKGAKVVEPDPDTIIMATLPQTPRVKNVIEYAREEAGNLNHNYVGTEHLLLGLLREQKGMAAQVLMNQGFTLEQIREEILKVLGVDPSTPPAKKSEPEASSAKESTEAFPHLPDTVLPVLEEINGLLEKLNEDKEEAVAEQDFEKAALLKDKGDRIKRGLFDMLDQLRAFIKNSTGESN